MGASEQPTTELHIAKTAAGENRDALVVESDAAVEYRFGDVGEAQIAGRGSRSHEEQRFVEGAVHLDGNHALRLRDLL